MWLQVAMVQMTKTLQRRRFTQQCFQAGTGAWPRTSMLQVLVRKFLSLWMVSFFFFLSYPMFLLLCHTYIVWEFDALPISSCFKHICHATGKSHLHIVSSISLEAPSSLPSRIDVLFPFIPDLWASLVACYVSRNNSSLEGVSTPYTSGTIISVCMPIPIWLD